MVAGRGVPFASADEYAGALGEGLGEIPTVVIDGVGRGDEGDAPAAGGLVDGDEVRGAGDAAIGEGAKVAEEAEVIGGGEGFRDLVEAAFLERDGDLAAGGF